MNDINWTVAEMMVEQALHPAEPRELPVRRDGQRGVKRSLGAALVRLGLRLDPEAGEALGALDLSAAHDGRRS